MSEHPGRSGGKPHGGKPGGQHGRNRQRKPKGRPLDGWLIIDKPTGMGSTDVVTRLKRLFDAQKCGHGGTLDPLATGVLPIAFGAATKTVPYVMDGTKIYRFTLRFGDLRDTDDADGKIIGTSRRPADRCRDRGGAAGLPRRHHAGPADLLRHQGGGERAYDLAREGQAVELAPRPARVDRFELESTAPTPIPPSSRCKRQGRLHALAGPRPGAGLRHGRPYRRPAPHAGRPVPRGQAIPLDKLGMPGDTPPASPDLLLPVATALADIPALALTEAEASGLMQGQAIGLVDADGPDSGRCRSRRGIGARHGGGTRDRALPPGVRTSGAGTLVAQEGPAAVG